jgi:ferric-dicitrate binding protein FerR (iron transport regulator)
MWRYGMLEFVDETVDGAVSEFNRYNRTRVVIDDPAIGCRRIGGRFSLSDIDVFVATVSRIIDLHTATSETSTGAVIHLGRIPREVTTNTSSCAPKSVYQKE